MAGESRSWGTGTVTSTSSRSPWTAREPDPRHLARARGPTTPSRPGSATCGAWSSGRRRMAEGSSSWTPRAAPSGASQRAYDDRWAAAGVDAGAGSTSSFRTPTSRRSTSCAPTAARRLGRSSRASSPGGAWSSTLRSTRTATTTSASSASIGRHVSGSTSRIGPTVGFRPWIPGSRCRSDGRRRSRWCNGFTDLDGAVRRSHRRGRAGHLACAGRACHAGAAAARPLDDSAGERRKRGDHTGRSRLAFTRADSTTRAWLFPFDADPDERRGLPRRHRRERVDTLLELSADDRCSSSRAPARTRRLAQAAHRPRHRRDDANGNDGRPRHPVPQWTVRDLSSIGAPRVGDRRLRVPRWRSATSVG